MAVYLRGSTFWIEYYYQGIKYRESTKTDNRTEAEYIMASKRYELEQLRKRAIQVFQQIHNTQEQPSLEQIELYVKGLRLGKGIGERRLLNALYSTQQTQPIPDYQPPAKTKPTPTTTLTALREAWLKHAANKVTYKQDETRSKALLAYFKGETEAKSITPEQIEEYKEYLLLTLKPATVNRHLVLFKSMFGLAVKRRLLQFNPFATVKLLKEDNQRERILTHKEYQALIANTTGQINVAITLGYYTAMRLTEVVKLKWEQIDLNRRTINLSSKQTKNKTARVIPIVEPLYQVLKGLNQKQPIFSYTPTTISKSFRREVDKLGLGEDLTFHSLRHTAITNLRRAGLDILTIKAISGHKTLAMLDRYNKFSDDDIDEVAKIMTAFKPTK